MKFNILLIFLCALYLNFISSLLEKQRNEREGDTIYFLSKSPIQNISNINYELNDQIIKTKLKAMKNQKPEAVQFKIKLVPK